MQAAPTTKSINLRVNNNIAGIDNPTKGNAVTSWTGTTVYFGNKAYYVLHSDGYSTGENGNPSSPGHSSMANHMLLLSKGVIAAEKRKFDDLTSNWSDSAIRSDLNHKDDNSGFYDTFTATERGAISETEISDDNTATEGSVLYPSTVTYDHIFLLDLDDVRNQNYGFDSSNDIGKTRVADPNCLFWWWLRSPGYTSSNAASVDSFGDVWPGGSQVGAEEGLARPAFNLRLSSVLFSSACGVSKSSSFAATTAAPASGEENYNTWNLTLQDGTGFHAERKTGETGAVKVGAKINITVTDIPTGNTNAYTQTLAMLINGDNTVICYGKIKDGAPTADSNIEVTIPSSVPAGEYKLKVFAECVNSVDGEGNATNLTDYASNMAEIPVTVTAAKYGYSTPSTIEKNGVTAAVSYSPESPQTANTNVTATVTLSGTAERAGIHTIGMSSNTVEITKPATTTKHVEAGNPLTDTFAFTFTVGEEDIEDIEFTHTFEPDTYLMEVPPKSADFGSKQVGYTLRPEAQTITIENKEAVSLTNLQVQSQAPTESSYEIGSTLSSIAPGEQKSFTIQPKSGFPIGTYHETFLITAEPEGKVEPITVTASFEVTDMDTCAAPIAAPAENTPTTPYASNQNVTLTSATEGADIYYTTDNSEPTLSSMKYTAPIPISGTPGQSVTTTIKAIAVKSGMKNSTVKTFSYTIELTENTYTLSVQNGTGSGSYKKGEAVTVSANVPAGKEFKQWKVTRGKLTLSDIYQAILHFFMPEEDIALSAEFRDADPTPNPAPKESSDKGEHKSHTCDFHWITVTEATSSADGEEVYQCLICGEITARQAISAFGSYNKEILEKIKNAKQGETLEFSTDTWMSFPAYILKALEERPDITLIVTFRYEGKHYSFTIPARKAGSRENVLTETDPVTGEIVNWYGFLYLSEKYGRTEIK